MSAVSEPESPLGEPRATTVAQPEGSPRSGVPEGSPGQGAQPEELRPRPREERAQREPESPRSERDRREEYGVLRADGDRKAVRFERRYDATPEELWSALTESDRLAGWLAEVVGGPVGPDRSFTFRFGDGDDQRAHCRIREFDPPRTLEMDWDFGPEGPTVVRFELSPDDGGTVLVLDHRRLPTVAASGYAAGWHAYLQALADFDRLAWNARFKAVLANYRRSLASLR